MDKITILQPNIAGGNEYVNIINSIIKEIGYQTIDGKQALKKPYRKREITIANFSWYENIKGNNICAMWLRVVKKLLYIVYLKKIRKCKIVITMHNKSNHDKKGKKISLMFLKWLCMQAEVIVILCEETKSYLKDIFNRNLSGRITEKCCLIPHPNYIGAYREKFGLSENDMFFIPQDNKFNLLFFGHVRPYKNIELLLELGKHMLDLNIRITIAGGGDKRYIREIEKRMEGINNVVLYPQVIPDEQIWSVIKSCDCVILPYHMASVLNSGACILAMSCKKNIICPEIGTIKEYPPELPYSYTYETEEEHFDKVYQAAYEAYQEYMTRRELFLEKQEKLHRLVTEKNAREIVKGKYRLLYERLEKATD